MLALLQYEWKIAIVRNELWENERLWYPTTERRRQVARIWELLQ